MKTMSKRVGIPFLLEHWQDIFDPDGTTAKAWGDPGGDGDGVPLLPLVARSKSVLELVKCLDALKAYAPGHHSHLMLHYLSPWRVEYINKPVLNRHGQPAKDKNGKPVVERKPERVQQLPDWSKEERATHFRMVNRSMDFLCATFRLPHVTIVDNDDLEAAA